MPSSSLSPGKPARKEGRNGAGRGAGNELGNGAPRSVTYEQIAARAYEIYEREGRQPGRELENWLRAEAELGVAPESRRSA